MSRNAHLVDLSPDDRTTCDALLRGGQASALAQRRARILLHADGSRSGPGLTDAAIAAAVMVSARTVARPRLQFAAAGRPRPWSPLPAPPTR